MSMFGFSENLKEKMQGKQNREEKKEIKSEEK